MVITQNLHKTKVTNMKYTSKSTPAYDGACCYDYPQTLKIFS